MGNSGSKLEQQVIDYIWSEFIRVKKDNMREYLKVSELIAIEAMEEY